MADVLFKCTGGYIHNKGDFITCCIGKSMIERPVVADNADDLDIAFVESLLTDRLDDVDYYGGP